MTENQKHFFPQQIIIITSMYFNNRLTQYENTCDIFTVKRNSKIISYPNRKGL